MHFGWRASWFLYFVSQWRRRIGFMNTAFATRINKDSDGALVVAARRGDARAFEELVIRHKHRVLATAQRITNNREDAEDVAQESFHKAFLHLDAFQEKSRFSTWLTRITLIEAFMLLRQMMCFREILSVSTGFAVDGSVSFVDHGPNPDESCMLRVS